MMKIPLNEIVLRIKEKTGLDEKIIEGKIDDKVKELSGLVSKDGAAHIVANEFGIQLFKTTESGLLKIKNIALGLKTASFVARILKIYPPKEFTTKKGAEGKVCSFLVGDETGKTRVVFWDTKQIELIEKGKMKEGDIVKITNCYVKEGINGLELHARDASKIDINPNIADAKNIPSFEIASDLSQRVSINTIKEEGVYEIRGAIVNILENSPFFDVCPECKKKVSNNICAEHGEVKSTKSIFISTIFDDGTDSIRIVFFGKQAEHILGMDAAEAFKIATESNNFLYPVQNKKPEILGREMIVSGKASKNSFSGELEMIGRRVVIPNPVIEAKTIMKELGE